MEGLHFPIDRVWNEKIDRTECDCEILMWLGSCHGWK
jgi:hypothetical protein